MGEYQGAGNLGDFARWAYGEAIAALEARMEDSDFLVNQLRLRPEELAALVRALALVGAAMAALESNWGRSKAFASCKNCFGIMAVGDQPYEEGTPGHHIRKFANLEECWASWAWLVIKSKNYEDAREVMQKKLAASWGPYSTAAKTMSAALEFLRAAAPLAARTYCPGDKDYVSEVTSIMRSIRPIVEPKGPGGCGS